MKKHHALVAIGAALTVLTPVVAGIHLFGGSLIVTGLVEWWYEGRAS